MAPNSRALKVHDELFPDLKSTLIETDPEFIALFDNFAFDEVYNQSKLDKRTRLITLLGALIACQAQTEFKVMLGAALSNDVTPVEMKEIVYRQQHTSVLQKSLISYISPMNFSNKKVFSYL